MRRWLAAAALVLAGACAAPARAEPPAPHREHGYIRLADGTELAYVVHRPSAKGRYPAVLQYDPYLGGGNPPDPEFAKRGYAFVGVNVPGTGCSQGAFDFFGQKESAAGAEVVEWIARQPWSSGAVGMWGYSYPGHTSLHVAGRRPPHLKAIVAGSITRDAYDDGLYPGGLFNIGLHAAWKPAMQPRLAAIGIKNRRDWGDERCDANIASRPADTYLEDVVAHAADRSWFTPRALETSAPAIRVPTLIAHTWQDHMLKGGDELFARLAVPRQLFLTNGGHSYSSVQPEVIEATFRWFDRWLKGSRNGVEREPPVTVLWETRVPKAGEATARWRTAHATWPLPEAKVQIFALSGRGELSEGAMAEPAELAPRDFFTPIGTELIGSNEQFALAPAPGGALAYRTSPLGAPLTILGAPEVTLRLRADQGSADLMVALHEVYPNGDTQFIQRGLVRAVPPAAAKPGEAFEVSLRLPSVGAVVRAGHRLELVVMSPPTIPSPVDAFLPIGPPGRVTVVHGGAQPSRLSVPVLASAPPPPDALACGSLPFQPCRPAPAPPSRR